MIDILFLNSSIEFARYIKRVNALLEYDLSATVIGYERSDYSGIDYNCETISLGSIDGGNYLYRVLRFFKDILIIGKQLKRSSIVYAFGLDMAFVTRIASIFILKKVTLLYEIGDIRQVMVDNGIKGKMSRLIESWILRKTSYLIITSDAYIEGYYKKYYNFDNNNIIVIENKLDNCLINKKTAYSTTNRDYPIVIGYFGRLRCIHSWEALKNLSKITGDKFKIILRGTNAGIPDLENEINQLDHISFKGPYISPRELNEIYSEIDLVWGAHYHANNNFLWARSCRFYESLLFAKPLIVQSGTYDAKIIDGFNTGISVNIKPDEFNINELIDIDCEKIGFLQKNIELIPKNIYLYENEHRDLAKLLKSKINE